mgnify:CR=1 FL=1
MEILSDAWQWILDNPSLVCGLFVLAFILAGLSFLYNTLIMPARVAINLAPIVPDLIVHRKEIKKGVEWVSEKVSKKDLDEIDLTEPDEI